MHFLNGDPAPHEEDMVALVGLAQMATGSIPTLHLNALFEHYRDTKQGDYRFEWKGLIAVWNDRYEEQEGKPPTGYSWFRDEYGNFLPAQANPVTGLFPSGASDYQEAIRREQQKEVEYISHQERKAANLQVIGTRKPKQLGTSAK